MMNTLNKAATRAICAEFGKRLGESIIRQIGVDPKAFNDALDAAIAELDTSPITKTSAAKTSAKPKGPGKRELQKMELREKISELGGELPEEDSIPALKATIKKIAREAKKAEKAAQAEEKKAAKAAKKQEVTRKGKDYTQRRLLDEDKNDIPGKNGKCVRVAVHKETRVVYKVNETNWNDACYQRYATLYPEDKDTEKKKPMKKMKKMKMKKMKKMKKKSSSETEGAPAMSASAIVAAKQTKLIAELVGTALEESSGNGGGESKNGVEDPEEAIRIAEAKAAEEAKAKALAEAKAVEEAKAKALAEAKAAEEAKALAEAKAAEEAAAAAAAELEEEEFEEIEEDEEDVPDFPGEEEVEGFKHEILNQFSDKIDYYKDDNGYIWDGWCQYVGAHDEDTDAVALYPNYEQPDEDAYQNGE